MAKISCSALIWWALLCDAVAAAAAPPRIEVMDATDDGSKAPIRRAPKNLKDDSLLAGVRKQTTPAMTPAPQPCEGVEDFTACGHGFASAPTTPPPPTPPPPPTDAPDVAGDVYETPDPTGKPTKAPTHSPTPSPTFPTCVCTDGGTGYNCTDGTVANCPANYVCDEEDGAPKTEFTCRATCLIHDNCPPGQHKIGGVNDRFDNINDYEATCCQAYACATDGGAACQSCKAPSEMTADNQCASCNDGYHLIGTSCQAWAGTCSNGELLPQSQRTQDNQCGTCSDGYYLSSPPSAPPFCKAYTCSTGSGTACMHCLDVPRRTANNQCESCNDGYYLTDTDTSCQAYTCSTGSETNCRTCFDQINRTGDDQCASCNDGYYLTGTSCQACPSVANGTCNLCSSGDSSTCTDVTCAPRANDVDHWNTNGDASDGCEEACVNLAGHYSYTSEGGGGGTMYLNQTTNCSGNGEAFSYHVSDRTVTKDGSISGTITGSPGSYVIQWASGFTFSQIECTTHAHCGSGMSCREGSCEHPTPNPTPSPTSVDTVDTITLHAATGAKKAVPTKAHVPPNSEKAQGDYYLTSATSTPTH